MPDTPHVGFRRLDQCVPGDTLSAVYRHARRLAKLHETLAEALDDDVRKHLMGVSGNSQRLVIFADTSGWATRLRYQTPVLEAAALDYLGTRPALAFRVMPEDAPTLRSDTPRSPWFSERVVATLEASARTVKDKELAEALRRLARGAAH